MALVSLYSTQYTQVQLGDFVLPGISHVATGKSKRVDKKAVPGQDGSRLTDNGWELGTVTITNRIYETIDTEQNQRQINELNRILPQLGLKAGSNKTPLLIIHPLCSTKQINYVWVESIDDSNPENGVLTTIIKCVQWVNIPETSKSSDQPKGTAPGKPTSAFQASQTKVGQGNNPPQAV